jgi:3-oxoacyl-[acyl-carrier protein] reductase
MPFASTGGRYFMGGALSVKRALVTGASRGIGAAIASSLLASGWEVVNISRGGKSTEEIPGFQLDLNDPNSIAHVVETIYSQIGEIGCLVANAGITKDALLLRSSVDDVEEVLRTNLTSSIVLAKEVLRGMIKQRFGRIIFISSVVALSGSGGQVAYSASKAGLIGAARSLAREVGSRGITVNVVAPGFIETDMTKSLSAQIRDQAKVMTPLGRLGGPRDVAGAVDFLASDQAAFITGAVVPVDGGLGLGH